MLRIFKVKTVARVYFHTEILDCNSILNLPRYQRFIVPDRKFT